MYATCHQRCFSAAVRTLKGLALPVARLVLLGPSRSALLVLLARTGFGLML